VTAKVAEVDVLAVHERGNLVYLLLRQRDGQIDVGHLLGVAGQPSKWRIVGFATMPGEGWSGGVRDVSVVRWTEDADLPMEGQRLIAVEGPSKI